MDQAKLKAIAKTILDETCQSFVANRGMHAPVSFYAVDQAGDVIPLAATACEEAAKIISVGITKLLADTPLEAVITAGPALAGHNFSDNAPDQFVLLVTIDSPSLTYVLYRNFEIRGSDIVLLDTVYPTGTPLIELLNREDMALHYFDGMREQSATAVGETLQ